MSKTLNDWLASSSSSSESDEAPISESALKPFSPATEGPTALPAAAAQMQMRSRMDETRAKMEQLLGTETVAKSSSSVQTDAMSSSPPVTQGSRTVNSTPLAQTVYNNNTMSSSNHPGLSTTQIPVGHHSSLDDYEPMEVMVVDRGTQTVSTIGVQTDPLPTDPNNHAPVYLPGRGGGGVQGIDYLSNKSRCGIDGRPYRQIFSNLEVQQARDAGELREQLVNIQNSIDLLIARYNLPPPPSFL